jgi:hypothetical protein
VTPGYAFPCAEGFGEPSYPKELPRLGSRSCALFLSLMRRNLLDKAIESPQAFIALLPDFDYKPQMRAEHSGQPPLFSAPSKAMQPR